MSLLGDTLGWSRDEPRTLPFHKAKDMTEITEAVERLRAKAYNMPHHIDAEGNEATIVRYDDLRVASFELSRLSSELTRLQEENGQLRLAICGGEDAPGYADSLPLADILGVAANNLGSWREASDRAARLQEEVKGLRDDARRYQRLRILGCKVSGAERTSGLLRFQNLDDFADRDIQAIPSRGEFRNANTLQGQQS